MVRDTLTHLDLSVYPEIALVIFLGVFVAVSIRVMRRSGAEARQASMMPLEEGSVSSDRGACLVTGEGT